MSGFGKPLPRPAAEEKPEWSPMPEKGPGWWLHRSGVFKTYAPDGSKPSPLVPQPPQEPDVVVLRPVINGLAVRNLEKS